MITDVNNHGTYTHLCASGGQTFFCHQPLGYVLATFPKDEHADSLDADVLWPMAADL